MLVILILAALLRFVGLNWDQNFHLNPDERFLTMVGNAMKLPQTIIDYLNPAVSSFNPSNLGFNFFVYGTLPLIINKLAAVFTGADSYIAFTLQGRLFSGLADLLVLIFVYKTAHLLEERFRLSPKVKYLASFLYAIAVFPIQSAHFFVVDSFLNLFVFASFYFALKSYLKKSLADALGSFLFFGLALATKITALLILPLNIFIMTLAVSGATRGKKQDILRLVKLIFACTIVSYLTIRLADPYLFQTHNFFNPTISNLFIKNLVQLKAFDNPNVWYPPGVQWIHKPPILYGLLNLAVFGIGLPYFVLLVVGIWRSRTVGTSRFVLSIIILWMFVFFLFQSTQYAKTMRYFILLYPYIAIFAGLGLAVILDALGNIRDKVARYTLYTLLFIMLMAWPLAFISIYLHPHSRVEASEWVYKNVANKSVILVEHWDDGLPLPLAQANGKSFTLVELPVFDPDTNQKWQKMNELLRKADYYILSSNRGWGSITTAPEKYPQMSKFYIDLLAGKLAYQKIKEFTSYPSLRYLGIPFDFPDQWADESFTVYDHPKVLIFKKVF